MNVLKQSKNILQFKLTPFQDKFVFSPKRFPAFIGGVGTGKTLAGILRMLILMENSPNNLGIIVRKEYTDLHDSTVKDWERYTGIQIGSNKEVKLPNSSIILFRHGDEINVLRNINAGVVFIEQSDEFTDDTVFQFLRDRLRRQEAKFRTLFLTANACGRNWLWNLWKNNPPSSEYELTEATTFDNTDNLPKDFIEDLKRLEQESPHHYARYVMNSWEDFEEFDTLIPYSFVAQCINQLFIPDGGFIIACDPAHFGDDETVIMALQRCEANKYKQVYLESFQGQDLMQTAGRLIDLRKRLGPEKVSHILIDDIGLGVGLSDRLSEQDIDIVRYKSNEKAIMEGFLNKRSEDYWKLRTMLEAKLLDLMPSEKQGQQLATLKFGFKSNGKKYIESKEDAKKRGVKSPDYADCLMMATSVAHFIPEEAKPLTSSQEFWQTVKRDIELESIRQKPEKEDVFRPI